MTSIELCPLGPLEATRISNATRFNGDGHTPLSALSKSQALLNIKDQHTLGHPVFVLDPKLQQSRKLPKENDRLNLFVCVATSQFHAGDVSLVMSYYTGLISSQFHLVFDDTFYTITSIYQGLELPNWNHLCRTSSEFAPATDFLTATDWQASVPADAPHNTDVLRFGVCALFP